MYLTEKIHVWWVWLDMSYSAIAHEFTVNDSTIYVNYVSLNKNIKQGYMLIGW